MENEYKSIYEKGFLPGPKETKEEFYHRIIETEKIIQNPEKHFKESLTPLNPSTLLSLKKNLFFYGSSTSIYETKNGICIPVISKPSKFSSLFVQKQEILAHEKVHARRALFEEPMFEEVLAFRTSPSFLRRYFSPILCTPSQTYLFLFLGALSYFSIIPLLGYISFLNFNLHRKQKAITRCLKRYTLKEGMLQGMTDKEILALSKGKIGQIDLSLFRWKFLHTLFGNIN